MDDTSAEVASLSLDELLPALTPGDDDGVSITNNRFQRDSRLVQQLAVTSDAPFATLDAPSATSWLQGTNTSTPAISLVPGSRPEPRPLQQHMCTSSSCAALKVFGTPELLATVLGFLDTNDVMFMRRINRTWARTVVDTPELRTCMFLRPQWLRPPADYMLLDLKIPGLSIQKGEAVHKGQWIVITMNASAARHVVPPSGPRYHGRRQFSFPSSRSLLAEVLTHGAGKAELASTSQVPKVKYDELYITQPPLLGLQAFMIDSDGCDVSSAETSTVGSTGEGPDERDDDEEGSQIPAPCAKMSCDAGINLDFIAETALALLREEDGRQVAFKAIISFCEPSQSLSKRGTTRSVIRLE